MSIGSMVRQAFHLHYNRHLLSFIRGSTCFHDSDYVVFAQESLMLQFSTTACSVVNEAEAEGNQFSSPEVRSLFRGRNDNLSSLA
jgi:hypothetical protein